MPSTSLQSVIVARARHGWGVSVGDQRIALHADPDEAREAAHDIVDAIEDRGERAVFIELDEDL
jgi:hypothetical protein